MAVGIGLEYPSDLPARLGKSFVGFRKIEPRNIDTRPLLRDIVEWLARLIDRITVRESDKSSEIRLGANWSLQDISIGHIDYGLTPLTALNRQWHR